jgi:hypothetical protein
MKSDIHFSARLIIPVFGGLVLSGFGMSTRGLDEPVQVRKILVVVQNDGTVATDPQFIPSPEDEAMRLALLLTRALPGMDIEGVSQSRVDGICARATECDEVHVYRRFHRPDYRLDIQLHPRSGQLVTTPPRVSFPCRVGRATDWGNCRADVIARVSNLVRQNHIRANPLPSKAR